ncbi:3-octaprenyl-4-hydroxybenzoate carboxy-lyase UbiX [Exophiala aquamarina CBS 119918]|uniref:Flavin prenyltransferase PAD1, mitochondrial n=1 Tax=Exophiala aquamarina CBS 119918 TaxID=1182545 RepID=A0A072PTW7_9EURO|nr:3-octaprenyl-4-hydroxybenzoate carboxy-lyase UbiX [Exophiala aquamarina CBS 119918]KEF63564.1 3-octaprenyl-4-hydroxybenzoate carboxy-lyase UbiX [Exophiala aquamarina CBS 119918]
MLRLFAQPPARGLAQSRRFVIPIAVHRCSHRRKSDYSNRSYQNPESHLQNVSESQPQPSGPRTNEDRLITLLPPRPRRIVVGITGATGTIYAIRMLEIMRQLGIETHLIISKWALATLKYETDLSEAHIRSLAHATYTAKDLSAPIASGSFQHDGVAIVPCSMKTLAAVRIGFCDDLISRAADVSLKEGRKVLIAVRETPLSDIHLENMLALRRAGAIIFPPVPAFYTQPKSLDELVNQSVGRMLDSLGIYINNFHRWNGFEKQNKNKLPRSVSADPSLNYSQVSNMRAKPEKQPDHSTNSTDYTELHNDGPLRYASG